MAVFSSTKNKHKIDKMKNKHSQINYKHNFCIKNEKHTYSYVSTLKNYITKLQQMYFLHI